MSERKRILVVDDDPDLRKLIGAFLERNGFDVIQGANGRDLDRSLGDGSIDLIVLDLMMPGEDGLAIVRRLRNRESPPIIMLSAIGEDDDRIVGLEVGADDYLAKPCNPRELLARIRAVLRRGEESGGARFRKIGDFRVDVVRRVIVSSATGEIGLSDAEFRVLSALMDRPHQVLSRDQLIEATRGIDSEVFDRAIDVTISRLRRKLAADDLIRTVRNEGYMLTLRPGP